MTSNKIKWLSIAAVAVVVIIIIGMQFPPSAPPEGLLTIDGYPVSEEELLFYMNDEKALAADYFTRTYGADVSAGDAFWSTAFDGQTPMDYVKQSALDRLIRAKQLQLLLDEYELAEYKSFDQLSREMAAENEKRAAMAADGEVFYGLASFDLYQYIDYVYDSHWPALVAKQAAALDMPEAELRALYESTIDEHTLLADELKVIAGVPGEAQMERTLDRREISKEDADSQQFWDQLSVSVPGETVTGVYMGELLTGSLTEPPATTTLPFEAVRENLLYTKAEEALRGLIAQRAAEADIAYNQKEYDTLTWR